MTIKKVVKKVVASVKKVISKPVVEVAKVEVKLLGCYNCDNSGKQCSVCTPVFEDTFGK